METVLEILCTNSLKVQLSCGETSTVFDVLWNLWLGSCQDPPLNIKYFFFFWYCLGGVLNLDPWQENAGRHISKSFWPCGKNTGHELSQSLMMGIYKQEQNLLFRFFPNVIWYLSSRCGVGFLLPFPLYMYGQRQYYFCGWIQKVTSCSAFHWILINIRSYLYLEIWHRHFRISGIMLTAVCEPPCTLRERIFCSEEQACFCIPYTLLWLWHGSVLCCLGTSSP